MRDIIMHAVHLTKISLLYCIFYAMLDIHVLCSITGGE